MGQLHLILEIRHRPQAADQDIGLLRAREIGHQITEADNLHVHRGGPSPALPAQCAHQG